MDKNWTDTENDDEARKRAYDFWEQVGSDMDAGQFWADRIKNYRDDPAKRLALALENLPLPASFKEAAVAVRALIRAKRKSNEPYDEELALLYWLAALRSFMLDYAPRLQKPGFNVVESIPGHRLNSLRYNYSDLGYRELTLLNKTDVKWITSAWGEPERHTTLNQLHRDLWDEYETKLIERRSCSNQELQDDLISIQSVEKTPAPEPKTNPNQKGCMAVAAVFAVGVIGVCLWLVG